MTALLTSPSYADTKTTGEATNACACSYCSENLFEKNLFIQSASGLHDNMVLTGGGGSFTPASVGNNNSLELLTGLEWGVGGGSPVNLTYSFPTSVPSYYSSTATERNSFELFSETMKTAARNALSHISSFANVTFTEVSGVGDLTFAQAYLTTSNSNPDAYAYYPDQGQVSGDVWFNNRYFFDNDMSHGEIGYFVMLHEIGHALGLQHTFEAGLTGSENSEQYSVMAYDISPWNGYDVNAQTFMLYDMYAIQSMYGANMNYATGVNNYKISGNAAYTIWNGGGYDTLDSTDVSADVIIRMEQGGFSSVGLINNIAIAYGTVIENATTGTGNDIIYANGAANIINGGGGNDTVNYSLSTLAVNADLLNGTGTGGLAQGDTYFNIENLIGSDDVAQRDYLWGNNTTNRLYGMAGKDILEGGGGADIIDGGEGWDYARYTRSSAGVNINLATNNLSGGDAAGDQLISIEAIIGSVHNDTLYGNTENNFLRGENGDDTLAGGGGTDQLIGGNGNDTYLLGSGTNIITETGAGIDTVVFLPGISIFDINLNVNNITFDASSDILTFNDIFLIEWFSFNGLPLLSLGTIMATLNANLTGSQYFSGHAIAETFTGTGLNDAVDYSFSLPAVKIDLQKNTHSGGDAQGDILNGIEHIVGSDTASERDYIYGNASNNALYGLGGDDVLEGGAGADIIDGGAGKDYARYTRSSESVHINLETNVNTGGDAQSDTLYNIENVVGSKYDDTIYGGNGNDYIKGEAGNDIVYGGGGNDQLFGGNGADTFLFLSSTAFVKVDKIRDFSLAQSDKIDISDLISTYDPLTDAITDFIRITTNGADSLLAVDFNGGADSFVTIAGITDVTGLTDENALMVSGNLIV